MSSITLSSNSVWGVPDDETANSTVMSDAFSVSRLDTPLGDVPSFGNFTFGSDLSPAIPSDGLDLTHFSNHSLGANVVTSSYDLFLENQEGPSPALSSDSVSSHGSGRNSAPGTVTAPAPGSLSVKAGGIGRGANPRTTVVADLPPTPIAVGNSGSPAPGSLPATPEAPTTSFENNDLEAAVMRKLAQLLPQQSESSQRPTALLTPPSHAGSLTPLGQATWGPIPATASQHEYISPAASTHLSLSEAAANSAASPVPPAPAAVQQQQSHVPTARYGAAPQARGPHSHSGSMYAPSHGPPHSGMPYPMHPMAGGYAGPGAPSHMAMPPAYFPGAPQAMVPPMGAWGASGRMMAPHGAAAGGYYSMWGYEGVPQGPTGPQTHAAALPLRSAGPAAVPASLAPNEIKGKVLLLSKDQNGCRMLQDRLDSGGRALCTEIFEEAFPAITDLMVDAFGNYLFQKLLERVTEAQRLQIVQSVTTAAAQSKSIISSSGPRVSAPGAAPVVDASLNLHGTRSVQKAIECCNSYEEMKLLVDALRGHVVRLATDPNGNHVVQKCLLKLPRGFREAIAEPLIEQYQRVGRHRHGCCVLQRCLECIEEGFRLKLIDNIIDAGLDFIQDPFANYVVQWVIEKGPFEKSSKIMEMLKGNIPTLAQQKFSSNVVEKTLKVGSDSIRRKIVEEMCEPSALPVLLHDHFANYCIQTAIQVSDTDSARRLVDMIRNPQEDGELRG